ncbi:phosphoribosylaminoimidazolesuccinocarboxamide synthase [Bacillus massiliigorillae]|uniref:phosphoribosylaminoimidazolesuccinocarboxamide synthase n=1 Tax=Bacillus massiliigorillae TaxID=1243664 RepID=UPI00039B7B11|nr:phosphoribosylaminoimidazolesuccinocarboxamide synthase [Bacillus massiliigorillae]
MEKQALLYQGKAKRVYATNDENVVWLEYTDQATAFNGEKKENIQGKGVLNNEITSLLFVKLQEKGIPSHFIKKLSDREHLAKKVDIIPLEVVVRNVAAGSLSKRLGMEEGTVLRHPIVELYYKNDDLGDPLITDAHISLLEIATPEEIKEITEKALKVNDVLKEFFASINIRLIDYKLEFGKTADGEILLADEISPDTCRLWDATTGEKLDKDVFRRDLGNITDAYEQILTRLGGAQHV